jgi:hypothetical protein
MWIKKTRIAATYQCQRFSAIDTDLTLVKSCDANADKRGASWRDSFGGILPVPVSHPTSRGNARPNVAFAEAGREPFLGTLFVIVRRYD